MLSEFEAKQRATNFIALPNHTYAMIIDEEMNLHQNQVKTRKLIYSLMMQEKVLIDCVCDYPTPSQEQRIKYGTSPWGDSVLTQHDTPVIFSCSMHDFAVFHTVIKQSAGVALAISSAFAAAILSDCLIETLIDTATKEGQGFHLEKKPRDDPYLFMGATPETIVMELAPQLHFPPQEDIFVEIELNNSA
ncbi:hypothetical protein AKJ16_DCAP06339, partial [Drosera capensis]